MVFNDLSLSSLPVPIVLENVRPLLVDLSKAIALLVHSKVVASSLRMTRSWEGYKCCADGTLFDAIRQLFRDPKTADEAHFLFRLSLKVPLLADVPESVNRRYHGAEPLDEDGVDGYCLILCAHLMFVAVSLPLIARFDVDRLSYRYRELLQQQNNSLIGEVEEEIDNVARSRHAVAVVERHRGSLIAAATKEDLWANRQSMFPSLAFGMDVENQIHHISGDLIDPILGRLSELNVAAEEWPKLSTPAPVWRSKVTPESDGVMNNQKLKDARIFRDAQGNLKLFEWHARVGNGCRIHLRFDRAAFKVEIGYIGDHLPLP